VHVSAQQQGLDCSKKQVVELWLYMYTCGVQPPTASCCMNHAYMCCHCIGLEPRQQRAQCMGQHSSWSKLQVVEFGPDR
jgi:hypothetical protein